MFIFDFDFPFLATHSAKDKPLELRTKYGKYMYFPNYAKDQQWRELAQKWNGASDQVRVPTAAFGASGKSSARLEKSTCLASLSSNGLFIFNSERTTF